MGRDQISWERGSGREREEVQNFKHEIRKEEEEEEEVICEKLLWKMRKKSADNGQQSTGEE